MTPLVALDGADGDGVAISREETVAVGDGEVNAAGFVVALGVIRCGGVFGTSNRPCRCEADAEGDDEIAEAAATGVGDCSTGAGFLGIIFAAAVEVAVEDGVPGCDIVADGDGVATADVDVPPAASTGALVVLAALTNFFGGGFDGGAASDFILSRVFLAAS